MDTPARLQQRIAPFVEDLVWIAARIVRVFKEAALSLMYESRSRDSLRLGHNRQRADATLYYSRFGRAVWYARQVVAVLSHGWLARKEIVLEGRDECDLRQTYRSGERSLTWPRPPLVEVDDCGVDDEVFTRLVRSYHLACEGDDLALPRSAWWEHNSRQLRRLLFPDGGTGLAADRLRSFLRTNAVDVEYLSRQAALIPENGSYVRTYLRCARMISDYHRFGTLGNRAIFASVSESPAGRSVCPVYRGRRISYSLGHNALCLSSLVEQVPVPGGRRETVLEIGGGYGLLARMFKQYRPGCYVFVELPEVLVLAGYYLACSWRGARIAMLADVVDQLDDWRKIRRSYDFVLLPPSALRRLPASSVDLAINTQSMGEMARGFGAYYLEQIERVLRVRGHFYSLNRLESSKYDDFGFFNWRFTRAFLTRRYTYWPTNQMEWIGQKTLSPGEETAAPTPARRRRVSAGI